MRVTNSKGVTYSFTKEEMEQIFMYAYGYIDLAVNNHLPVFLENHPTVSNLTNKMQQCFNDEFTIKKKTIRTFY